MSEKWTKGPWWVEVGEGEDDDGFLYIVHEGTESPDTTVCSFEGDGPHDIANAHLIAAAPDLWDALAALVEHDEYLIECEVLKSFAELERAKAALNKARGES